MNSKATVPVQVEAGLVSTVIPVFNRGSLMREAVSSVLAQTYERTEIVIVNDGSTDDTQKCCDELRDAFPGKVRTVWQKNSGPGAARQTGIEHSKGEFVQFLDSDDTYLPEKTALLVAALNTEAKAGIAYGKSYAVHGSNARVPDQAHRSGEKHEFLFPTILTGRIWHANNPLYRRETLLQIGAWPNKRNLEDWEFDAQTAARWIPLAYVDEYVMALRHHSGERLGTAWSRDIGLHRQRIDALQKILGYAEQAGVDSNAPEMQLFVRTLLLESRIAAQFALVSEAKLLAMLARRHSAGVGLRQRLFEAYAALFGWHSAGKLVSRIEKGIGFVRGA